MTYYIEYIFLENFIIDFILIYVTGSLLKKKIIIGRILLASFIGAIYVLAITITNERFINTAIVKISVSILMITISYNPKSIINYIKLILSFYIISLLLVGVLVGINYLIKGNQITIKSIIETSFFIIIILKIVFTEIKRKQEESNYIREINIKIKENIINIRGLIDTGNELFDILTGKPVIIVEKKIVDKLLEKDILIKINNFYNSSYNNLIEILKNNYDGINFRIIKYKTISSKDEIMLGIVPDKVWILKEKKEKLELDVIIGIYPEKLSYEDDYQALLHKQLLELESEV